MTPKRGHSRSSALLDFYSCFLIPAYTLLFAGSVEWFSTNFSVRAVLGADYYRGFVYWGVLAGVYFFVMMTRLTLTFSSRWLRRLLHLLILTACLALAYAVAIPYLPDHIPRWARLHVALASGACVLLMAALLFMLLALLQEDRKRYLPLLLVWGVIVLVSGGLFVQFGMVTTALEIFFTISATLLTRSLWLRRISP